MSAVNVTDAAAVINLGSGEELEVVVLDLRKSRKATENPANAEVWAWTFVNRPDLLTHKAKLNIVNNIMNQRAPFTRVGRITDAAIAAYAAR